MSDLQHHRTLIHRLLLLLVAWTLPAQALTAAAATQVITNLQQLSHALASDRQTVAEVDLEVTVCASSRHELGVLIVQDKTGSELLEIGDFKREIRPGERIRIRRGSCVLKRREMGVEISAIPVLANDGRHPRIPVTAEAALPAGKIPLRLEWFNFRNLFSLDVAFGTSNQPQRTIPASNLWHAVVGESGVTNFLPGLVAEYYEGTWERLPDFNLLHSIRTKVVTNFDLSIRSRNDRIGIRFTGYLDVPRAGQYRFVVWSDDGTLLYLGDREVPVIHLGQGDVPAAEPKRLSSASFTGFEERPWSAVEGRVSFVTRTGEGVTFDLSIEQRVISVRVADSSELDLAALPNSRIRIRGIGRAVMAGDQALVLGRLYAASGRDLDFIEPAFGKDQPRIPITSVVEVQRLPIEEARKALPVRLRGTVTDAIKTGQEHWMSFQDDTRGIFVTLNTISNANPAFGELWEVEGHSAAGNFAPIVVADAITRLGEGVLPAPIRPTWAGLLNGSRDVQWAELTGLVSDVHSNTISLDFPEGRLDVELEGSFEPELRPFLKAVVRIRGVLYAIWDSATREVRVGRVMMRNSAISVEVPAPADPFNAVLKTPRELLLFDAQASALRPVKVRGQIVYSDSLQLFLETDGMGLRVLPMEKTDVQPGDLVEAVGYPDIGRNELTLRETLFRRTGTAPLSPARELVESRESRENLNSIRVRVDGKLLGWHSEESGPVLEMQRGDRLYLARFASEKSAPLPLRPGSRLALQGVYVGRAHGQSPNGDNESFELLLNSLADITVLSQPLWWTLPRLLALLGALLVILVFTVIWNTQLRRLVEQRTGQLQREIRQRERLERQHALETERSRIARDLHDDLGSSLTEISVLASRGQIPQTSEVNQSSLFQSISSRARSLIAALDVIVWAVDPGDNSMQSLADYLTGYTTEFFSHTQIACRFKVPVSFPPITIEGRVRHEVFMAVKEALNNVVRHANATELELRLDVTNGILEIDMADNGKGVEGGAQTGGHGLKNLSARLDKLGGTCRVEPRASGGTIVQIRLAVRTSTGSDPAPDPGSEIRRSSDSVAPRAS